MRRLIDRGRRPSEARPWYDGSGAGRIPRFPWLAAALIAGCAQASPPPGGPSDGKPPEIVTTIPDSIQVLSSFNEDVEFRFNEVIGEGARPNYGRGDGDLERLIVLSPDTSVPKISWKRDRITVKPRGGWRPNRVYRIELLPGIADLSQNVTKQSRVITFTTGAPLPTRSLSGRVVDWTARRGYPRALVEAILLPDSLPYRSRTDSAGRFTLGPLPDGQYLIYGVIDENFNGRRDRREAFDTVHLTAAQDSAGEIWAFVHDTVPPRIQTVEEIDSLAVTVIFSQMLDPDWTAGPEDVRVLAEDSTRIPIERVLTPAQYDSLYRRQTAPDTGEVDRVARAKRDSAARADSIRRAQAAAAAERGRPRDELLKGKPPLSDRLVIRFRVPLQRDTKYRVEIMGARNVSKAVGDTAVGLLKTEAERKAPSGPPARRRR